MSRKEIKMAEDVAPNLVPMIDIMFLLLLFFMLSADMTQREFEEVVLPKAEAVKKDEESAKKADEAAGRLTVNVYHLPKVVCEKYRAKDKTAKNLVCREKEHWRVGIKAKDFNLPAQKEDLQKRLDDEAKLERRDPKNPTISERKVMIRVDELAPYGLAQQVMNLCANVGIYKIEVGAAAPPDAKKKPAEH